jgi:tetratricopeptide (TPR) repeat protein
VRVELRRYHDGVHEVGAPAAPGAIAAAERRIGRALPAALVTLYHSFDGLRLFVDGFVVRGTAAIAAEGQLVRLGETPEGPVLLDDQGRVLAVDEAGDRAVAGSTLERWLTAVMVREGLLMGADGEWRDVFGDDGGLTLEVRQKRVRAGLRVDADAAVWCLEAAELAFELGKDDEAEAALEAAVAADPGAAAAWELLGGVRRRAGRAQEAADAYADAAAATRDGPRRARRAAEAARAAREAGAEEARVRAARAAREADPGCADALIEEADARLRAGDAPGAGNLAELARALDADGRVEQILSQVRIRAALRPLR